MKIEIDTREPKSRRFKALCEYKDHEVEIKQLESGDYVFNDEVAFEYKTISDFASSIIGNRIFKQIQRQLQTYKFNYICIVGNERDKLDAFVQMNTYSSFSRKRYENAILSLSAYATIIYADNEEEALERMLYVAKHTLAEKMMKPVKISKNTAVNYLSSIDHINVKTATKIVEELKIKTLKDLVGLKKKDLLKVKGVGDKTANRILESIL